MDSMAAWTAEIVEAVEAAVALEASSGDGAEAGVSAVSGPEVVEAMAAVAASVAVLGRIIGPDLDDSPAGPGAATDLDRDPLRRRLDAYLNALAQAARTEAINAALKVRLAAGIAELAEATAVPAVTPRDATAQEMSVIAEIACALTVSERAAGALLSESRTLASCLPLTLAALQSGSLSWQHARIVVDETTNLEPAGAAALEAHFLDPAAPNPARGGPAGELAPSRFRAKARTWRERHHPVSIEKRHAKGIQDRRLEYTPDRDGMAWLGAYLPADQAAGIWDRTTTAARALQGPHEARTLTQIRADLAATWLLTNNTTGTSTTGAETSATTGGGTGAWADAGTGTGSGSGGVPSPTAQVLVTVPVLSLLGRTDEPATLDGYGPVPPSMARRLISDGATSFLRVLTDPRDGAPLEIGRTSYRVTKAMRQWLRLRDGKCPFPGCNNHSLDNEADHLLAWARGGTTGITNLGQPCPKHHRLRHTTAWTPTGASKNEPPGWTSPTGRHYPSEQPDWEPPQWGQQDWEQRDGEVHGGSEESGRPGRYSGVDPETHMDPETGLHMDPGPELDIDPDPELGRDRALPVDPFPEWIPWPPTESDDQRWWPPENPEPDEIGPAKLELPDDPLHGWHLLQQA